MNLDSAEQMARKLLGERAERLGIGEYTKEAESPTARSSTWSGLVNSGKAARREDGDPSRHLAVVEEVLIWPQQRLERRA
jgi:hypothetical protein